MRRMALALAVQAALVPALLAGGSRIAFTRRIAPPHDLAPAERVAIIYAIGDNDKVTTFVEELTDAVNRAGTLHIENAVDNNQHVLSLDQASLNRLRIRHPADLYLAVNGFTCSGVDRMMEGSEYTSGGERVKRMHHWVDATCRTRVDVVRADNGKRLLSYRVRGEGTSPRSSELSQDERDVAYIQAARYAAVSAAEMITPRLVRESIELDESAPAFDEAFAMIRSERFADARAIWEAALHRHPASAPLQFDLGAVSEALGDLAAAREHFQRAVKLSPRERHYSTELTLFQRRNAVRR
jgi:tetratricopeptide (TPR) repeat protein